MAGRDAAPAGPRARLRKAREVAGTSGDAGSCPGDLASWPCKRRGKGGGTCLGERRVKRKRFILKV